MLLFNEEYRGGRISSDLYQILTTPDFSTVVASAAFDTIGF